MTFRLPVNTTSGSTANGSCRLSTTWLSTSNWVAPLSPAMITPATAGMIASPRVISRRSHKGNRISRNPSMTI